MRVRKKGKLPLRVVLVYEVAPLPAHIHAKDDKQGQQGKGKE
jgi:hypothetical protein